MPPIDERPPATTRAAAPARWVLAGLVAIAFAASLALASSYPLLDPDEGRNAEVAREMAAAGDLLVPRLAGMPYLDKPPALFWLEAAAFRAFGVSPLAARLPAALAALLSLWLVGALALETVGPGRALRVVALLATAPLFAVLSAYVIFDMLLTACVTIVWVGVARDLIDADARPSRRRHVAMFAALALGILTKGPVMLAWGVGGTLAAVAFVRSRAALRWLAWWPGWALMLAIAGGWFALAVLRHPEYPHYAFVDETFRRMTTGAFRREQPWWFVPAVLAGGALPWSLVTPWGRRWGPESRVALGFVVFAVLFFTISRSKLVTYLLPALPPLAWLAAEAWSESRRRARAALVSAAVFGVLAATAWWFGTHAAAWGAHLDPPLAATGMRHARGLALAIGGGAVVALAAAGLGRPSWAFAPVLAFTPLVLVGAGSVAIDYARSQSGAPLARAIERAEPGARVRYERTYSPGTDFLLGRIGDVVSATGEDITSNYQSYYRDTLLARGAWRVWPSVAAAPEAGVIVRSVRTVAEGPPDGWTEFHRGSRFVAYRRTARSR